MKKKDTEEYIMMRNEGFTGSYKEYINYRNYIINMLVKEVNNDKKI